MVILWQARSNLNPDFLQGLSCKSGVFYYNIARI
jgi:hypothetical protein